MMALAPLALAAVLVIQAQAQAQGQDPERPSEAEIFGAPPPAEEPASEEPEAEPLPPGAPPAATAPEQRPAPPPAGTPVPPPHTPETERDEAIFPSLGLPDPGLAPSVEAAPEDPLRVGGLFYLRAQSLGLQAQGPEDWSLSTPALLDAYLDARPNERVRGLIVGRMLFDPTLPAEMGAGGIIGALEPSGATMGTAPLSSLFVPRTRGPTVVLDQMWLRFDIERVVFVTAGKQHVRWGTARFWTPTDFLHIRRRNPLDVFDARTGTTMLKLHLPWEARGWNFYAYGLTEGPEATPAIGDVAGAARAELVFGTTEIGAGALVQRGRKPKLAADASTGLWDFDLYGEVAVRYGSEIDRVELDPNIDPPAFGGFETLPVIVDNLYPAFRDRGLRAQAVAGLTYSRQYADKDVINIGVEYFYNMLGYDSPEVYPGLVLPRPRPLAEPATFFYLGRHYAAVFVNLPGPYSWDNTTFTLSTLGNLSDRSFITRLDYSLLMLTHLRFEAFAAVRYGTAEGEFRFGVKDLMLGGLTFSRAPALFDVGLALRVSI
jgi:hypothetical protein